MTEKVRVMRIRRERFYTIFKDDGNEEIVIHYHLGAFQRPMNTVNITLNGAGGYVQTSRYISPDDAITLGKEIIRHAKIVKELMIRQKVKDEGFGHILKGEL